MQEVFIISAVARPLSEVFRKEFVDRLDRFLSDLRDDVGGLN